MNAVETVALRAEAYADALNRGDVETLRSFWSEERCCLVLDPARVCVGVEAICADYLPGMRDRTVLESVDVNPVLDDAMVAVARLRLDGETSVQSQLWILERGQWRLCHVHAFIETDG